MKKPDRKARRDKKEKQIVDAEIVKDIPENEEAKAAEAETAEAAAEEKVVDAAALQASLEAAQAKNEEYLNMLARTQADFDNFRRRNESVRADAYADGQRNVMTAMLAVLDNLERATDAAGEEESPLKSGVELTLKQMRAACEKLGVTPIDRMGEKFDPNLENAIMQGAPEDGEPGTVCMVLQKGYMMGDKVIRHAMVKVVPD